MARWWSRAALALGLAVASTSLAQDAPCRTPSSTFELIQVAVFDRSCSQSYCHGEARVYGLDLRPDQAYESAVRFVEPGNPERSSLWYTAAKKTLGPDLPGWLDDLPGAPMPIGALPLSRDRLEALRLWILAGAPKAGVVDGVSDLLDPCPPATPDPDDAAIPPPCDPDDPDLLLPDLVIDPPGQVRVMYRGQNRIISFNTEIGNTGQGPLIIQAGSRPAGPGASVDAVQVILKRDGSKCSRQAGTAFYKYQGKEWSYADIAYFELRKDDPNTGEVLARRFKDYYCLADTDPIRGWEGAPHQYDLHCEDLVGRMGISVGYKDMYHRVHPGQWIDLDEDPATPIEPGTYYLVQVVDENAFLMELDDSRESNANYTLVRVSLPDPDGPAVEPSPPAQVTQPSTPGVAPSPTPSQSGAQRPPRRVSRPARPVRPARLPRPTRPPHAARPDRPGVSTPTIPSGQGESVVKFDNDELKQVGPVEFSHPAHKEALGQEQLDCRPCHVEPPPLFQMQPRTAGEARYTMEDMKQGKACGACHDGESMINGKAVFDATSEDNCGKCHDVSTRPTPPVIGAGGPSRPRRPARPARPVRQPRPARPPRPGTDSPPPLPTPTATHAAEAPGEAPEGATGCENACRYDVSQLRMTWYDHMGLNLSFQAQARGCPALTPETGEQVTVRMHNWVTGRGQPTGLQHSADLVLANGSRAAADGRSIELSAVAGGLRVTYRTNESPVARYGDGARFPVAFDLCITLGDQAVAVSLACQPKAQGMLCHEL